MTFTAEDIQTQQFHVRFRGFDVDEIDAFLEKVAEHYLLLTEDNKKLGQRISDLENEMATFKDQEKTFQNAFLSAQKIAEEMQEKSRHEAEELLLASREKSQRVKDETTKQLASQEKELERLQGLKSEILAKLRHFLQSRLDTLEDSDQPARPGFEISKQETIDKVSVDNADGHDKDLDDLDEKIDLDDLRNPAALDNFLAAEEEEGEQKEDHRADKTPSDYESESISSFIASELDEGEEDEKSMDTLPDLDGDMLFSLDDPLDGEDEPAVINDEDPMDKKDEKRP